MSHGDFDELYDKDDDGNELPSFIPSEFFTDGDAYSYMPTEGFKTPIDWKLEESEIPAMQPKKWAGEETFAGFLLAMVKDFKYPSDWLITVEGDEFDMEKTWADIAVLYLGLKFASMSAGLKFRAIWEEWDQQRIMKECF
jgi:hypothetical protein